jgi:AcrR family transcriptional regulator
MNDHSEGLTLTEPSPVRRGPYPKGIERRRQIVEAAVKVFAKYGYAGGSLRRIAAEVGVTNASLIRHFGSKEALLTAVLERWSQESVASVKNASGMEYFRSLIGMMEYHSTHRNFNELFLTLAIEASNVDHPAREFFVRRYDSLVAEFVSNLTWACKNGEIVIPEFMLETEARGLIAVMDGIELQWLLNPNFDLVALFKYQLEAAIGRWRGVPNADAEPMDAGSAR